MKYEEYMKLSVNEVNKLVEKHIFGAPDDVTTPHDYLHSQSSIFAIMAASDLHGFMVNLWADNSNGRYILHIFPKFEGMPFVFAEHKGIIINDLIYFPEELIGSLLMAKEVIEYDEKATTFCVDRELFGRDRPYAPIKA